MKKVLLIIAAISLLLSCEKDLQEEKEVDMPVTNGVITPPISVSDVAQALGVNSTDVGYLCSNQHGRINKWAKYKPVIFANLFNSTDNPTWWKAGDGMAGFDITIYNSVMNICNAIDSIGIPDWPYKPPTGGLSSPYRITDFNRYNHNAKQLVQSLYTTPSVSNIPGSVAIIDLALYREFENDSEIWFSDIDNVNIDLKNWYFGVAVRANGSTSAPSTYGTADETLQNRGFDFSLPVSGLNVGSYEIYPFLCDKKYPGATPTKFILLPGVTKRRFAVTSMSSSLYMFAYPRYRTSENKIVDVEIEISRNGSSLALNDIYLYLKYYDKDFNDPIVPPDEQVKVFSDIQISANGKLTLTHSFNVSNTGREYAVWLYFSQQGIASIQSKEDIEPAMD